MFHTATSQQIKDGLVTDVYFERTEKILRARGIDKEVRAEFKQLHIAGPSVVATGSAAYYFNLKVGVPVSARYAYLWNRGELYDALSADGYSITDTLQSLYVGAGIVFRL